MVTGRTFTLEGALKVPKKTGLRWEGILVRFMRAAGVSNFQYAGDSKRFTGVFGFSFVRATPRMEGGWSNVPFYFHRYETERNQGNPSPVVMFLTQRDNGEFVGDSYVLMRLGTFAPLLAELIASNPNKYLGKD